MPGLDLSRLFYEEAVRPILETEFAGLAYSAALLGAGSEVLGYDTPISTDHDWGPRLQLFLAEETYPASRAPLVETLSRMLPRQVHGYATHFGPPDAAGVRLRAEASAGPVAHRVEVHTVRGFFSARLGLDPTAGLAPADWLTLPEQRLLEVTAGQVYFDGLGALTPLRAQLAYYPRDVWLARLAAQWRRIAEQEAFVGRSGDVGDELGSQLVAAAIVHDLMRICFLLERRYAPYSKWFGTAFARLACAPALGPRLRQVLGAPGWQEREARLAAAYGQVAALHNGVGLTPPLAEDVSPYFDRPYRVIHADRFVQALEAAIVDRRLLAEGAIIGAVDQFSDSTNLLTRPAVYRRLRLLYDQDPAREEA
jgi:hypothetical protein